MIERAGASGVAQRYVDPAAAASEAVDKVAAARVWLLKEKPFFGVLARALLVSPTLSVAAFRLTEDDRLLVNPISVLEIRFPALCARVAHVAMHAALGAFVRRGEREARRWNAAHDLAIAPLLRAAGMPVGPELAVETLGAGASAEEHYGHLEEGTAPDPLWCDLSDPLPPEGPPPIAGTFTRQDDGEGEDDPEDASEGGNRGEGKGQGADSTGESESEGEDEGEGEHEEPSPEVSPEVSPIDARARELQWKMRLSAALEEERASGGKTFGELPAWVDDMVRATIEPPPDWSATLQRSIATLARSERSFMRPSRRMSALSGPDGAWPDVVAMPGRRVVPAGVLAAVVDTSASIGADVLSRFLGALASVATAEGFDEIRLVQADAEVTSDEVVFAGELLFKAIAIVGRGGTDYGPALRLLSSEARRNAERFTVVYLTDLDGRFPHEQDASGLDVVWATESAAGRLAPFGRVIAIGKR